MVLVALYNALKLRDHRMEASVKEQYTRLSVMRLQQLSVMTRNKMNSEWHNDLSWVLLDAVYLSFPLTVGEEGCLQRVWDLLGIRF